MNSTQITSLADATSDTDAVNVQSLSICSPWTLLGSASGTLGSTDTFVSLTSLDAYDNYRVFVYCRLITNTSRVLRLLLNNDSVATNYTSYYNIPANNINFASRTVDGIGLWFNNTIEGARTFEIDIAGSVATDGDIHSISFKPSYPSGTISSDCYFGGIYANSSTKQITSVYLGMYDTVSTNTINSSSDDMEVTMQIYGSNFSSLA
jgi:hypothetical protein